VVVMEESSAALPSVSVQRTNTVTEPTRLYPNHARYNEVLGFYHPGPEKYVGKNLTREQEEDIADMFRTRPSIQVGLDKANEVRARRLHDTAMATPNYDQGAIVDMMMQGRVDTDAVHAAIVDKEKMVLMLGALNVLATEPSFTAGTGARVNGDEEQSK
jgi:hypothetical protein